MNKFYDKLEERYKKVVMTRKEDTGILFYFKADDFGLITTDFSFKTKKGYTLNGHFYHYGNPRPDRLVVFEHGMGVGHRAYFREIERIAREGYLVYSYDHTGCTESEGEYIMGLGGSLPDLDDCISALIDKGFDSKNISVIGHSWGGYSTMNILSRHPSLKNVVALSGFVSVKDMQKQVTPKCIAIFRPHFYKMEKALNPDHYKSSAIESLTNTEKPVLIIHSIDDNSVHITHFIKLQKALKNKQTIKFLKLDGKLHHPTYTYEAVNYREEFFKEHNKRVKEGQAVNKEEQDVFLKSYDWYKMTNQDEDIWRIIFDFLEK